MKVLDLFAGSGSISKAAGRLGFESFSVDIEPFEGIDLVKDIRKTRPADIPFVPDIIWASPPCTSFSVASMWRHWDKSGEVHVPKTGTAILGIELVRRTFWLIWYYQQLNPNLIWYMENPRGLLRKMPVMKICPIRHTVSYCQYGDIRMKPTDIWTNNVNWNPRPICRPGASCHTPAPRGTHGGTQGQKNSFERSKVPEELCLEVLKACRPQ
ncbi:MAG: DNA cytosine methyltransferase [Flavobacteriales bacterium]|nr:DNA cytosine methyltransferase [Flavobacteriales bacterium]